MAYITDAQSRPFMSFAAVAAGFKALGYQLRYGRMLSVLGQMSDAQLKQVGITRSDIPAYAAKLVAR